MGESKDDGQKRRLCDHRGSGRGEVALYEDLCAIWTLGGAGAFVWRPCAGSVLSGSVPTDVTIWEYHSINLMKCATNASPLRVWLCAQVA